MDKQRYLMCAPAFFGVEYEINPWMRGNQGVIARSTAQAQWDALYRLLIETLHSQVQVLTPHSGLPDLVFTANAGLVYHKTVIPARFRHPERQREEPHFAAWFARHGWTLKPLPASAGAFEGAGDALFDTADRSLLWAAHGFRTDLGSHAHLGRLLDVDVVSLRLVDPRFYHLDTCFCPLPGGGVLWYPAAFDRASRDRIVRRVPSSRRVAVSAEDATYFACNAVAVNEENIVLHRGTPTLIEALRAHGFQAHLTSLSEFLKSGGAAKCLTLRLN